MPVQVLFVRALALPLLLVLAIATGDLSRGFQAFQQVCGRTHKGYTGKKERHTHTDAERDTHARTHTHTAVHAHDSIPTTEARAGKLHICAHALAAELHENTHSAEDHIRLRRRHISCRHVAAAQLQ